MFKVNNKNTRATSLCPLKSSENHRFRGNRDVALVFLLLTVNIFRIFFFYFYCWLWTSKYWLGCLLKLTKIMLLSKIIPDSGPLFQINLELNIWSATYNLPVCLFWIILFSFRLISYALETVYKRKHFHMMPLHVQKQPPDLFC